MTLEQLKIFVAVAEREHVTRAAGALNLTQSAVSAAVAALEQRHGVVLFHRVGRRIELTDSGRLFLDEARAVLARAATAELVLSELGSMGRGTLILHASQTIASYWLPAHIVAFRQAHPLIEVRLVVGNTLQVARAVVSGAAELGFVEGLVEDASLAQAVIGQDRLVIVVDGRHPWAGAGHALQPAELLQSAWVMREPGSGTRSAFEAALGALGIAVRQLEVALELPSNEAVRAAVEAGAGATAISEMVAEPGLRAGTLHRVRFDLPDRQFHVLHHRERYSSDAGRAFMAIAGARA
ncbi:LysR family transcriptional regulator [Oleomonas cavernae]|uniref:LysR family transcriptional regulator n=1 Tax=Oleomonas cavernae TaxID=2320859 RepID=A0A418WIG0_9PROT|nr:LysR family transcriptional regulator [Oleomonas cavernae]RJF89803.1 LysR family transcriptional regulator [Oleomonas cavernae]